MKNLILLAVAVFIITACGDGKQIKEGKEVMSRYANGGAQIEHDFKVIDGKRLAVYEWEYYEDGNILKEGPLDKDQKRDGLWKSYFRNGNLWSEGGFKNGLRQGITKTYHDNGNLYYRGNYNKTQKSGIWKFYDRDGKFDYEIDYNKRANVKIEIDSSRIQLKPE